ncbi:hypothetical protein [Microbacterium sp. CIAB417]|uniref:MGH1-like glycoside hydrolase domain-containing protein n=1 Tax=Microbacterium sp. CIAB417 TaxID=2860287 RepID=UPI001FAD67D1|nr:hypothetical protein [Microbacterium sp. CIAB417]
MQTMTARDDALQRLREADPIARAGIAGSPLADGIRTAEVRFAAVGGPLEERWHRALAELSASIGSTSGTEPVLLEGGVYPGTWLESTGSISADVLRHWAPEVARETLLQFAEHQRDDGLLPYKVTADGPAFSQIQIVTPLARVVWRHYLASGRDRGFLRRMYDAMVRGDQWLARHRDTRGTGAVEAFCTFDTGHDLSPRFWFAPDRCHHGDAQQYDPDSALLPYIAPDLTANVACQRAYLGRIADELGEDGERWRAAARESTAALWEQCFHAEDGLFYDRDRNGRSVRIASDVLLRVLACEIGDEAFFAESLERYLLNTRKFLAHYGFTSIAMDDPRFDRDASRNSWGGPVNFLSLLRAPDAFEHHGHAAELAAASAPVLAALAAADRFPQCLDPFTGEAGFTTQYSPSILWFLDALERWSGIREADDGDLWFSGASPTRLGLGAAASAVATARRTAGGFWELAADDDRVDVHRDGELAFSFPRGWRVITDPSGVPWRIVGLGSARVGGDLVIDGRRTHLDAAPDEILELRDGRLDGRHGVASIAPVFD